MNRPDPSSVPELPGVYVYKDQEGKIIYVGKAINLRKRVLSYFRPTETLPIKTVAMIRRAFSIDFITTTSEKEAFLLESNLIKKHRPHYNICLRDDKQYIMFRLSHRVDFPRLEIVRHKLKRDGADYFGPFTSGTMARETWNTIHKIFPLRRCSDRMMQNRETPCLYQHIQLCSAPCTGNITKEEYQKIADKVRLLLSGKTTELINLLKENINNCIKKLDFEKAALLRDQIRSIEKTTEKQAVVLKSFASMDVIAACATQNGVAAGILFVRNGKLQDRCSFFWEGLERSSLQELLRSVLIQFYHRDREIPSRILLSDMPWHFNGDQQAQRENLFLSDSNIDLYTSQELISQEESFLPLSNKDIPPCSLSDSGSSLPKGYQQDLSKDLNLIDSSKNSLQSFLSDLKGGQVYLSLARNEEDRHLIQMAKNNALDAARKCESITDKITSAFRSSKTLKRIECVDVSHTSGQSTKVGMVVFQDGHAEKEEYRVWNLEGTFGDDYLSLSLWAQKRFEHGQPWPDLLLIDGGKGQIASVQKAFQKCFGSSEFPFILAGIAKARNERGYADRRAGNVADKIFLPFRSNPLNLKDGGPELLFLQSIRNATHDFSIGRHRIAREKQVISSELEQLPGIGAHIASLLWSHFDSIERMKTATIEELLQIHGIGRKKAELIINALKFY